MMLNFTQNYYDFRNQRPKNMEKMLKVSVVIQNTIFRHFVNAKLFLTPLTVMCPNEGHKLKRM